METTIVRKSSFKIIGIQFRGNNDNNACPKLWDKFAKRIADVKPLALDPITAFGVCSNCDIENNIFDYTVGLEVKDLSSIPTDMISMEIPAQEYAVIESTLPTLIVTLDTINNKWLPNSNYLRTSGPEFELYDAAFNPEVPESKLLLYIPIIKK